MATSLAPAAGESVRGQGHRDTQSQIEEGTKEVRPNGIKRSPNGSSAGVFQSRFAKNTASEDTLLIGILANAWGCAVPKEVPKESRGEYLSAARSHFFKKRKLKLFQLMSLIALYRKRGGPGDVNGRLTRGEFPQTNILS